MIVGIHFVHSGKTGTNIWFVPQVTVLPKSEIALLCFVLLLLSSLGSLTQRCVALCCSAESIEISLKAHGHFSHAEVVHPSLTAAGWTWHFRFVCRLFSFGYHDFSRCWNQVEMNKCSLSSMKTVVVCTVSSVWLQEVHSSYNIIGM